MTIYEAALIASAFLCALVAGLVFTFAVVVMPGIRTLPDVDFLRAFKVIDGVIQQAAPLFMLVWVGSVLAVVAALASGFGSAAGLDRWLVIAATVAYIAGVQVPTISINVPLNNRLQALELDRMDPSALAAERTAFEARWNRSNVFRTVLACVATLGWLVLLWRL